MPHIAIEYTSNLEGHLNVQDVVDALHSTAQQMDIFPQWGIRTFATAVENSRVAEDVFGGENGYVHVRVKVAGGRDDATLTKIIDGLHGALSSSLSTLCSERPVGFQLEVFRFDPAITRSGGSIPGSPTQRL
ncbi:hypothetical protein ACFULT_23185 [Rhodococcus sp. NPDC057297]|uniref:hypothetical protein n=1 Tax=Rhodococcus sp. NPDC057297 TaxID=3346090 RepID=UPI003635689B